MRTKICISVFLIALFFSLSMPQNAIAGGYKHKSGGDRPAIGAVGIRFGWSGGITGLSYKQYFGKIHGLNLDFGYNIKEARHSDRPWTQKGNWMLSVRYQPSFMFGTTRWIGFYGSIGATLRYHNYRSPETKNASPLITPDANIGFGMIGVVIQTVELFADIQVKYYNAADGAWKPAMESGIGVRVRFGKNRSFN